MIPAGIDLQRTVLWLARVTTPANTQLPSLALPAANGRPACHKGTVLVILKGGLYIYIYIYYLVIQIVIIFS